MLPIERKKLAARYAMNGDYSDRFPLWLAGNWPVYCEFERIARADIKRHRTRLSAKCIFEMIRWNSSVREEGGIYKINNTFTADCSRLFESMNPRLKGHFEFRERTRA